MQVIYSYLQENSKYHQAIFLCQCFRSTAIQVRIVVNKMQLYNICRNDKTQECVSAVQRHRIETNRRSTSWFSLSDFGVPVIRALMRGIHPRIIFKMVDVRGVNASHKYTGQDHGVSIFMTNHCESWRGSGYVFLAESSLEPEVAQAGVTPPPTLSPTCPFPKPRQ